MDISSIRKANLINLVDKYGSQKEFAEAVDTAAAYLSQIANGTIGKNGKPASMGAGLARKIETKLNLEYGYMDHTHPEVDSAVLGTQKLDNNDVYHFKKLDIEAFRKQHNIVDNEDSVSFTPPPKPKILSKRWVPVKAYSKMGMDGYFTDMGYDGNGGDGYVPTHSAGPKAFGIRGTGDSMFPAIRNGWFVVCDPDAEPVPTEFVQVCLKDGRCTIKEFIGINGGVLSLLAVNGGERLSFDMDEVESITAITDIIPPSQHKQDYPGNY